MLQQPSASPSRLLSRSSNASQSTVVRHGQMALRRAGVVLDEKKPVSLGALRKKGKGAKGENWYTRETKTIHDHHVTVVTS